MQKNKLKKSPLSVLCLIARLPGLRLLNCLLDNPLFNIVGIFTHSKLPSSEDPCRGTRPEFSLIQQKAQQNDIPLFVIDYTKDASEMKAIEHIPSYDLLLSLNWKFLVPPNILGRSRIADINLHRGQLPKYKGLEPIHRMLADGLNYATITAHIMNTEYDSGTILHEYNYPAHIKPNESLDTAVARIKKELIPMYPPCAMRAIDIVCRNSSQGITNYE